MKSIMELQKLSLQTRLELIRMFGFGKANHYGGSLSCVELAVATYFYKMRYSAQEATDPNRDRFIMAKGHAVPTQYVMLALCGVFPLEELRTVKKMGTRLQGHPDVRKTPGIEAPTGSLGQGLSFANGMALAARMDGLRFNIYVLLGDGELQEGQIWEAAMTSAHQRIGNICVLVDYNKFQAQGSVNETKGLEPLEEKWRAFGWKTRSVDGHDLSQICGALDDFNGAGEQPSVVIAHTIKGKGISFMENTYKYHNAAISEQEFRTAEEEVLQKLQALALEQR